MGSKWQIHACDVCRLLDNDRTLKECYYCGKCDAWICRSDQFRLDRRIRAMKSRSGQKAVTAMKAIVVMILLSLLSWGQTGTVGHAGVEIPVNFFGQHIQQQSTPWPAIGFGAYRMWSNSSPSIARWAQINTKAGTYDFTVIDSFLSEMQAHGIKTVVYTFGEVPKWASSNPTDTGCDFAANGVFAQGGCDLPLDIAADGTGTNKMWIDFVTALAKHVNDATYLKIHAHIRYWEPWNEWWRNNVVNNSSSSYPAVSVRATYAQMVRMAEDLRCIVTGTGSVNGAKCTKTAIDPTALITTPSDGGDDAGNPGSVMVFQNYLYCNGTGTRAPISGSKCTTGSRGSAVSDVMNTHFYELQPERLSVDFQQYKSVMSKMDQAKPFWSGEGGWGSDTRKDISDPDIAASWISRYYLMGWAAGFSAMYWYAYDGNGTGVLWNSTTGLNKAGIAYGQTFEWMAGSSMNFLCNGPAYPALGVYMCGFVQRDGTQTLAVWDTSKTCVSGTCTTGPYTHDPKFITSEDVAGNVLPLKGSTVQVGIKPIMLFNVPGTVVLQGKIGLH